MFRLFLLLFSFYYCINLIQLFQLTDAFHVQYPTQSIQSPMFGRSLSSATTTTTTTSLSMIFNNNNKNNKKSPDNKSNKNNSNNDNTNINKSNFNIFQDFTDMMSNFDDVVDDFLFKRMGNGEVFYGKRKYKPSGRENTDGQYNGLGRSDLSRICQATDKKEQQLQRIQAQREEQEAKRQQQRQQQI